MKISLLALFLLILLNGFCQDIKAPFEESDKNSTPTHDDVIDFYQKLSEESPLVTIEEMGLTDSGYPLHLIKVSDGGGKKLRLLINNGIHPGEPDGIDASMMLAKELIKEPAILKEIEVYIIPIYNIGGSLNRNATSRVNQQGPAEYGFRGNARNYDLNRDFIKADTRNTRSFYEIFHAVDPDIFIDTHVSNGADYQHINTHLFTQHNKLHSQTGEFLNTTYAPAIVKEMAAKGDPMTPYVNVFNRTPETGFSQFMDWPRYSTGYTALFNKLGMMIETHMLKPYKLRVESTLRFLNSAIEVAMDHKQNILNLRDDQSWWPEKTYPLDWELDRVNPDSIDFLGYEGQMVQSKVTGKERLYYNHEKPFEKKVPFFNKFNPTGQITVPLAYILPQGWHEVIDLLIANKAEYRQLSIDTLLEVGVYKIKKYKTSERAYEGHYPHSQIEVERVEEVVKFRKGDFIFPVDQKSGRYLMEVLEPKAHDSFFSWNFFDTMLQRKEGFSPYVFEDIAENLLNSNPQLKAEFEAWKEANEDFRENWFAQLQFIYENSDYAEEEFRRYPVYRIEN